MRRKEGTVFSVVVLLGIVIVFVFNDTATTEIYTLSLHDALPISAFLTDINDRMVDLEDVFKAAYVDVRFDGSTSIKKVLPVICPELSYNDLVVQDGTSAMESWERMINADGEDADQIASALLSYCERDTFAMVEIYRFLTGLVSH